MAEESADVKTEEQEEEEGGLTEAERQQLIAQFEAKIDGGEFAGRSFHNAVKDELYPLIGDGNLEPATFAHLVRKWARANNPHDWETRSYLDEP